jgi:hypothetical protein
MAPRIGGRSGTPAEPPRGVCDDQAAEHDDRDGGRGRGPSALDADSVVDRGSVGDADRWSMVAADPALMADASRGPQRGIGEDSSCGGELGFAGGRPSSAWRCRRHRGRTWPRLRARQVTRGSGLHGAHHRRRRRRGPRRGPPAGRAGVLVAARRDAGRRSGHIINIVSLAGLVAAPGEALYTATKHAALAFSVGTYLDLRRDGVRENHVSAVCPDGIWTLMPSRSRGSSVVVGRDARARRGVAQRAIALLDRPRPVLSIPRRLGWGRAG